MPKSISLWTKKWLIESQIPFCFLDQHESSNEWAKEKAFQNIASPTVFLVNRQTKGKGQGDKKWEDSDLTISFLWKDSLKEINASSSEDFTKDLKQALEKCWPKLQLSVKAPNDLYLNGGKTAGILLEVLKQGSQTALIAGLGLNVFSCPKNINSACLKYQIKDIHFKTWKLFLSSLFSLWCQRASFNTS